MTINRALVTALLAAAALSLVAPATAGAVTDSVNNDGVFSNVIQQSGSAKILNRPAAGPTAELEAGSSTSTGTTVGG